MIYTIENEFLRVKVSTVGATLVSFIDKKTNTDIVLGFDDQASYFKNTGPHLGATVGRNANRIADGSFVINGEKYQLSLNEPGICLHSGVGDLSFRGYTLKELKEDEIVLSLFDGDMSGGFPGNLNLEVSYSLKNNQLIYSFTGLCDKDSVLNITNHSYFNLNGGVDTVFDQELKIYTDKVALNVGPMASDEVIDVKGTAFDFTTLSKINDVLSIGHSNLSKCGLDHNYVFEDMSFKKMAELHNDKLSLTVESDLPDMHIYTGNYLGHLEGKDNHTYEDYYGICFECQYYPNGINYDDFIKPYIYKDKEVNHKIVYTLEGK
ncbi:MAG: galactose mutarotase [Solobacterium sp.]|nr:galactose mutarotase [Solobacterium sp.]MDY4494760.1 aldose epimerase family protein [Erysipelotrichaceae bacterium]MDY5277015.1 aldose epimerase family protein [Erysipelotrichaceae bacterium]